MRNSIPTKLFIFVATLALWYLLGAFIAFDYNPLHWLLFTTWWGRVLAIGLLISTFFASFNDEH